MLFATLKKVLIIFTKNIENVNPVILKEAQVVIKKTRTIYQIEEKSVMQKTEKCYL